LVGQELKSTVNSYLDIAQSLAHGLFRIWGAEAASARLMCALTEFYVSDRIGLDGPGAAALQHLNRIPYSSYESLAYITDVSHLVYATTLLDTFLSDTTLFLLLLHPASIGKNYQIPLQTLLSTSSRNEAITQAGLTRTREIGYLPFPGRIQFLKDTFGLIFDLDANAGEILAYYPSVRNTAVHDQGIFELILDNHGQVTSRMKACPRRPTKINGEDVYKAIKGYENVCMSIAWAVFAQVLKEQDHPAVQQFFKKRNAATDDLQPSTDSQG
jgi:hypothetical protein